MEWFADGECITFQKFWILWEFRFTGTKKNPSRKIRKMHHCLELPRITCPLIVQNWSKAADPNHTEKLFQQTAMEIFRSSSSMKDMVLKYCNHKLAHLLQEELSSPTHLSFSGHASFLNSTLSTLLHNHKNKYSDFYSEAHFVGNFQYYW